MTTTRELLMSTLSERISWFRQAPRLASPAERPTLGATCGSRPRCHSLMTLPLTNRDHEDVILRPLMWTMFEL
jgi:hypothetical protein